MSAIKKEELIKIDLLTPLTADFLSDDVQDEGDYEMENWETLTGTDLVSYEDSITDMIQIRNDMGNGEVCNLMDYFDENPEIQNKVESAIVSVKCVDGVLYGCTTLTLNEFLESDELNQICDYITGQYSDGWGEGFEQQDIRVDGGVINVHFWQPVDFTFEKDEHSSDKEYVEKTPQKPKLNLIGHDGNIFAVMASAKRLLQNNGMGEQAVEMVERVTQSGNYYKALGIISEYVETEISQQKEKAQSDKNVKKGGKEEYR